MRQQRVADVLTLAPRRRRDAGFTLVEILVVMSIIAITTGAAMLRLGIGNGSLKLNEAAAATAVAITNASDIALTSGQDSLIEVGLQGFRARPLNREADWQAFAGVNITNTEGQSGQWTLTADGSSAPFDLRLSSEQNTILVKFDGLTATVEGVP